MVLVARVAEGVPLSALGANVLDSDIMMTTGLEERTTGRMEDAERRVEGKSPALKSKMGL